MAEGAAQQKQLFAHGASGARVNGAQEASETSECAKRNHGCPRTHANTRLRARAHPCRTHLWRIGCPRQGLLALPRAEQVELTEFLRTHPCMPDLVSLKIKKPGSGKGRVHAHGRGMMAEFGSDAKHTGGGQGTGQEVREGLKRVVGV
eukprot:6208104-Pleurochrysis_carterae.AAC.1